jgi:phosphate-selective porin OprO/OprP
MRYRDFVAALALAGPIGLVPPGPARAEDEVLVESAPVTTTIEAGESEAELPARRLVKWNEYQGPISSLSVGAGFLYDFALTAQNNSSIQQVGNLPLEDKLRDFRFLLKGRFRTHRKVTWTMGLMFDDPSNAWLFRETGIMVEVPEISSHFFVGRTKEGYSLNKVMVGYAGWTMERFAFSDATIPILADGIKWLGYVPDAHVMWNLGGYAHLGLGSRQSFESYDHQIVGRVAWLPMQPESSTTVVHIGLEGRYGSVANGQLQLKARPEAFPEPFFINTGAFPADHTWMGGMEAYYRPGPWLVGAEYWFESVASPQTGNPLFHGGDIVATWIPTGEIRGYNTVGGFFKEVIPAPAHSIFNGGSGAWELVLRQSYADLNGGSVSGGRFWRLTPQVNWYLSDMLRLEAAYGYSVLDRFGLTGTAQFFQMRLQVWLH